MASEFHAISGTVSVGLPAIPPSIDVWAQPSAHHPLVSRQVFHETLHLWQYVAAGYLAKVAEEDWIRLQRYLDAGEVLPSGPRRARFLAPHAEHGFSASDLTEGVARYWDVQVISPPRLIESELSEGRHRFSDTFRRQYEDLRDRDGLVHPEHGGYSSESFDLAMEGAGGGWAEPYRRVRAELPDVLAASFFPAAGFLALQTDDPVGTFMLLLGGAESLRETRWPDGVDIALMWQWVAPLLQDVMNDACADRVGSGLHVAQNGPLAEHPMWGWLLTAGAMGVQLGGSEFLYALEFPGDPEFRRWLIHLLLPPLVVFADGTSWNPAKWYGEYPGADLAALHEHLELLSEDMRHLAAAWRQFLRTLRGY